jgi:hypothetical protein
MKHLLTSWALGLATILSASLCHLGCSESGGSGGGTAPAPPPAAATVDFDPTRQVDFDLSDTETQAGGDLLTLRVALDPGLQRPLFVGQVRKRQALRLPFSVPRTADTFHYELYDEHGPLLRQQQPIPAEAPR